MEIKLVIMLMWVSQCTAGYLYLITSCMVFYSSNYCNRATTCTLCTWPRQAQLYIRASTINFYYCVQFTTDQTCILLSSRCICCYACRNSDFGCSFHNYNSLIAIITTPAVWHLALILLQIEKLVQLFENDQVQFYHLTYIISYI